MNKSNIEKQYQELLDNELFLHWILHPTDETNEYWTKMIQENPEKEETIQNLKTIIKSIKIEEEPLSENVKSKLWQNIEAGINRKQNKKNKIKTVFRYVAAVTVLSVMSFYFYTQNNKENENDLSIIIPNISSEQQTSGNVIVVLANNEKIEIENENAELIYDTDGKMSVNAKTVKSQDTPNASSIPFNQIFVPYGKTSTIILSDGTKIWINSGSRVIYPSVFHKHKREIYIEGEAFLEVAQNKNAPFIVKTDKLEVNVLGTSFNLSAYKNDENQLIVLATGTVAIKDSNKKNTTIIKPNQKFTYENRTAKSHTEQVDILHYISWKYGFLFFEKENLNNILKKIERYYNIPLAYQNKDLKHITLSGKLDLKENIEETFRIISITTPISYQIEKDKIIINVKP